MVPRGARGGQKHPNGGPAPASGCQRVIEEHFRHEFISDEQLEDEKDAEAGGAPAAEGGRGALPKGVQNRTKTLGGHCSSQR